MCNTACATPSRALQTTGWMLLLAAGVASVAGCSGFASMQDWQYQWTNKHRASVAYASHATAAERREQGSDYGDGFKKGFYDASTGRGCKTPAVPPPCYWAPKYQSIEGQECIQNWYRGYQCGVAAAEAAGFPAFHEVPVGPCAPRTNSSGCQGCYSPDYCECGHGSGETCLDGQCSAGVHSGYPTAEVGSHFGTEYLESHVLQSSVSPLNAVPQLPPPAMDAVPQLRAPAVEAAPQLPAPAVDSVPSPPAAFLDAVPQSSFPTTTSSRDQRRYSQQ